MSVLSFKVAVIALGSVVSGIAIGVPLYRHFSSKEAEGEGTSVVTTPKTASTGTSQAPEQNTDSTVTGSEQSGSVSSGTTES